MTLSVIMVHRHMRRVPGSRLTHTLDGKGHDVAHPTLVGQGHTIDFDHASESSLLQSVCLELIVRSGLLKNPVSEQEQAC